MTEKQKKVAMIIGVVVIGLIILLWPRKGNASSTIENENELAPINISIPGFNIPERSPIAINIPALPAFSPYAYSPISPCMCNGAATYNNNNGYNGPLVEFVTNAANSGPNIYNYQYQLASQPCGTPIYCPQSAPPGRTLMCQPGTIISYDKTGCSSSMSFGSAS